jgi:hypothetical protein
MLTVQVLLTKCYIQSTNLSVKEGIHSLAATRDVTRTEPR